MSIKPSNIFIALGCISLFIAIAVSGVGVITKSKDILPQNELVELKSKFESSYITGVEAEAIVTLVEGEKDKVMVSLVDDGSKFWLLDKNQLADEKEDFEKIFIVLDESKSNILKGEKYELDGVFYNVGSDFENTDNLKEVSYNEYKELEDKYLNNYNNSIQVVLLKYQVGFCTVLGLFMFCLAKVTKGSQNKAK